MKNILWRVVYTLNRTEQNKYSSILFKILVAVLLLIVVIGAAYGTFTFLNDEGGPDEEVAVDEESENSENDGHTNDDDSESSGSEKNGEAASESETTEITISTVGDIMAHDEQYWGAYVEETDSYDFKPVFEHVKPYLEEADLDRKSTRLNSSHVAI